MSNADALCGKHPCAVLVGDPTSRGVAAGADAGADFIVVDTRHGVDLARMDASLFTSMAGQWAPTARIT